MQGRRLAAFSSAPLYDVSNTVGPNDFGDERPLAAATARFAGSIDVCTIFAEGTTPLQGIRRSLELHDEPLHAAGNTYWMTALLEEARQQGIGTLLTGQRGNFV